MICWLIYVLLCQNRAQIISHAFFVYGHRGKRIDAELLIFTWIINFVRFAISIWPLGRGSCFKCLIFGHRWIPRAKPVTRSFDVLFDMCLIKRLSEAGDLRRHRAQYNVIVLFSHWVCREQSFENCLASSDYNFVDIMVFPVYCIRPFVMIPIDLLRNPDRFADFLRLYAPPVHKYILMQHVLVHIRCPFHSRFSLTTDGLIWCSSIPVYHIATQFCRGHEIIAVTSCTKFCSNQSVIVWQCAKSTFHRIYASMENF